MARPKKTSPRRGPDCRHERLEQAGEVYWPGKAGVALADENEFVYPRYECADCEQAFIVVPVR